MLLAVLGVHRSLLLFALWLSTLACNKSTTSTVTPLLPPLRLAPIDAGGASSPPPTAIARGEVLVSILTRDGGYWSNVVKPDPPGDLVVKRCIDGPDAVRPLATGSLVYSLVLTYDGPSRVELLERSTTPPLPNALVACVSDALTGLKANPAGLQVGGELLAYVSLR
jgi:hypothetical protein